MKFTYILTIGFMTLVTACATSADPVDTGVDEVIIEPEASDPSARLLKQCYLLTDPIKQTECITCLSQNSTSNKYHYDPYLPAGARCELNK